MSEYIVDVANDDATYKRVFQKTPDYLLGYPVRERIVRCRDCDSWSGPCEIRPGGIEGVCDGWSATGNVVLTREDDFCSYGARRDGE